MNPRRLATPVALIAALSGGCQDKAEKSAPASGSASAIATATATTSTSTTATATATATTTESAALPATVTYTPYRNTQFKYSVDVASVFTHAEPYLGPAGQEWKWGDKALMNVGALPGGGKTIKQWNDAAKGENGTTTSSVIGNFFLKTGTNKGKIFWQKSILKGDMLYTLRFEYNEDLKTFFDPIITKTVASFAVP